MFAHVVKYLLAASAAYLLASIATPLVRTAGAAFNLRDVPDARRLHKQPIPRLGGIAVFTAFHVACALIFLFPWPSFAMGEIDLHWWLDFLIVSGFLFVVGLIDDCVGLRWILKLAAQAAAATAMFACGVSFKALLGFPLPEAVDYVLTVGWFLGLINAFNLIDGMDGLATGLAIIAAAGLAGTAVMLRVPGETLVLLALIGAGLGFLRYNFHPASIFLGDCGSMFLGFALAAISLSTTSRTTIVASLGVPLLAMGVPIFDTILAVWRRSVRSALSGRAGSLVGMLFNADMEHLHHRLVRRGLNQRRVAMMLYGLNVALVAIGFLTMTFASYGLAISLLAMLLGVYVVVKHLARVELWDSGALVLRGVSRPSRRVAATVLYPLADYLVLCAALMVTLFLTGAQGAALKEEWFQELPTWVVIPFVCLVLAGTYNRVWSRARVSEFAFVTAAIGAGGVLCVAAEILTGETDLRALAVRAVVCFAFSALPIAGLRAFPRLVQDLMGLAPGPQSGQGEGKNIIVYGAGSEALLFLKRRQTAAIEGRAFERVVGLVDDDRNLRRRVVHGYRVLGQGVELTDLIKQFKVTHVVLATQLHEAKRAALMELCRLHGVELSEWVVRQTVLVEREMNGAGADRRQQQSARAR